MQEFYKQTLILLVGLTTFSLLIAYMGFKHTFLENSFLPVENSEWPWWALIVNDEAMGGQSTIELIDDEVNLSFNFELSTKIEYPFAYAGLAFEPVDGSGDGGVNTHIDLSAFDTLSFMVKCSTKNNFSFFVYTFDDKTSKPNDILSYRTPTTFFTCSKQWEHIELDLTRLETPQWWLEWNNIDLATHRDYSLKKVPRLAFSSSPQTLKQTPTTVQLHDIKLSGRNWIPAYIVSVIVGLLWVFAAVWLFRQHTKALTNNFIDKAQRDRPLIAYQQLTLKPQHDKDKSSVLRFMATEYADSDLKTELGYTFITYLNKVRLTEAARIFKDDGDVTVAEVAYSVGYKNVSYFNKLFKEEYECTPKTFIKIHSMPAK